MEENQNQSTPNSSNSSGPQPNQEPQPSEPVFQPEPPKAEAPTPASQTPPILLPASASGAPTMAIPRWNISSRKAMMIAIVVAILLLLAALAWRFKGTFLAATVNGSPISRYSIMREAEKQAGKRALDFMVVNRLVDQAAAKKSVVVSDNEITEELKKISENIAQQGGTLQAFLTQQGITQDELKKDIALQKKLEKLLGDLSVSDAEVDTYIKDQQFTFPEGADVNAERERIKTTLKQQKFNEQARAYVEQLRKDAKINYYVSY